MGNRPNRLTTTRPRNHFSHFPGTWPKSTSGPRLSLPYTYPMPPYASRRLLGLPLEVMERVSPYPIATLESLSRFFHLPYTYPGASAAFFRLPYTYPTRPRRALPFFSFYFSNFFLSFFPSLRFCYHTPSPSTTRAPTNPPPNANRRIAAHPLCLPCKHPT